MVYKEATKVEVYTDQKNKNSIRSQKVQITSDPICLFDWSDSKSDVRYTGVYLYSKRLSSPGDDGHQKFYRFWRLPDV